MKNILQKLNSTIFKQDKFSNFKKYFMTSNLSLLQNSFSLKSASNFLLILVLQSFATIYLYFHNQPMTFVPETINNLYWLAPIMRLIWVTFVSTACFFLVFNLILAYLPRSVAGILNLSVVIFYIMLLIYHVVRGTFLDYSLFTSNFSLIWDKRSFELFKANLGSLTLFAMFFLLMTLFICEKRFHLFRTFSRPKSIRFSLLILLFLLPVNFGFIKWYHRQNANELFVFAKSFVSYSQYHSLIQRNELAKALVTPFPIAQKTIFSNQALKIRGQENPPHVFIILLESFSAKFVGQNTEHSPSLTPVFDQLTKEGWSVENFYSNSMQTGIAVSSTFCGLTPSFTRKIVTSYTGNNYLCLPKIFKKHGYQTLFFQGDSDPDFDNASGFIPSSGFDSFTPIAGSILNDDEKKLIWGWGIRDDIMFKKSFAMIDIEHSKKPDKPLFVGLMSITNHTPFEVPPEGREIYPNPTTNPEKFSNTIHLADKYLATFMQELANRPYLSNSIVIITGDHGFPMGQHDANFSQESGFHEELFRVPFVMLWKNHLPPKMIKDRFYSQMDIAPTLMDLLGFEDLNHFAGRSIFTEKPDSTLPLIQPYDGTYLSTARYPLRYTKYLRTGTDFLYDVVHDPEEKNNLIHSLEPESWADLRQGIQRIFLNQQLLDENRIFPSDKK